MNCTSWTSDIGQFESPTGPISDKPVKCISTSLVFRHPFGNNGGWELHTISGPSPSSWDSTTCQATGPHESTRWPLVRSVREGPPPPGREVWNGLQPNTKFGSGMIKFQGRSSLKQYMPIGSKCGYWQMDTFLSSRANRKKDRESMWSRRGLRIKITTSSATTFSPAWNGLGERWYTCGSERQKRYTSWTQESWILA